MMFKKCRLISVIFVFIATSFFDNVRLRYVPDTPSKNTQGNFPVPWIGVLKYKDEETRQVWVCGIVLISSKVAIGNAGEIAKIHLPTIKDTTKAMFPKPSGRWLHCGVHNYTLHPEFNDDTLTTLGLLSLDYEEKEFKGEMLQWAQDVTATYDTNELFVFGFNDDDSKFKPVIHRMEYVKLPECNQFYADEKLDSKWMRPVNYKCYKGRFSMSPCVFDAGMALASNISGKWTLVGISTWGPGCALPARFITLAAYVPWLNSKLFQTRRAEYTENYLYKLEKLAHNQIILSSMKTYFDETVGTCHEGPNSTVVYREESKFLVPDYGLGWFTFSMYDHHFFDSWDCVHITAGAQIYYKSQTSYWKSRGFEDSMPIVQRLRDFVRIVPIPSPIGPRNDSKILTLIDRWENYRRINITNFHFTFQFHKVGRLKIICYGRRLRPIPETFRITPAPYRTRSYKLTNRSYRPRAHAVNTYPLFTTPLSPIPYPIYKEGEPSPTNIWYWKQNMTTAYRRKRTTRDRSKIIIVP